MSIFAHLCRFVDWDFRSSGVHAGTFSIFIAFLPVLPGLIASSAVGVALAAPLSAAWISFVAWRIWRMLKAEGVKSDRKFDRTGKFALPPEYWASESITSARQRRRSKTKGR